MLLLSCRRVYTKAGFSMYIYPTNDIVSGYLADPKFREWEQYEIGQVRYALNKPLPAKIQAAAATSSSKASAPLFIDVGANVGVFTLSLANLGARVYAFEGACGQHLLCRDKASCDSPNATPPVMP